MSDTEQKQRRLTAKEWGEIKTAYLAESAEGGEVDLRRLSERFGVNYGTLRNKISEQGWHEEAKKLRDEVVEQVRAKILPEIVNRRVETANTHLEYTAYIRKLAMGTLAQYSVDGKDGKPQLPVHIAARLVFSAMQSEQKILADLQAAPGHGGTPNDAETAAFRAFFEELKGLGAAPTEAVAPSVSV